MDDGLSFERELFVPAELVFEVWTRPEHLAEWYPGQGERLADAQPPLEFELRRTADDAVLERVERLGAESARALHWLVRRHDGGEFELEIGFSGGGGTCTLSLHQRGFGSAPERDRQAEVWEGRLARLEAYFSVI